MKTIKKVATTPIQEKDGLIIDSFNTTDNKHKNAPSMAIVEEKFNNKSDKSHNHDDRYYQKTECDNLLNAKVPQSNFAVISSSITAEASTNSTKTHSYPSGFTKDNCVVISTGTTSGSGANNVMCFPKYAQPSNGDLMVRLMNDNIEFTYRNFSSNIMTINYKFVLLKVS